MKNVILQSLGLDLVNINMYAKFHHKIRSVQNLALDKASTDDKCYFAMLSVSMCMQTFIKIFQMGYELSTFLANCPGENLHKQAGDKILTNSFGWLS